MVYQIGTHSCPINEKCTKVDSKTIEEMVRNQPNIKPSEIQSSFILNAFQQKMGWDEVEKAAMNVMNKKQMENIKQKVKKNMEPYGHNFEAVVTFKQYADKKDLLYIYKVNDKRGNPDKPSFVFKTSTQKMQMAHSMNQTGDHFMKNEFCFFDGKHKRCNGFITLTASVYHPLLRKQIPLATMEAESETTTNIELFWNLFNEALQKATGNPDNFNPIGFCSDMAGSILAGLSKVFSGCLIKSCEFHFKDCVNQKGRLLQEENREEFKELCNKLLMSTTLEGYEKVKKQLDFFIQSDDSKAFLKSWLSWWHERRGFIFRAFTMPVAPKI